MTKTNLERYIYGPLATITLTIFYHLTTLRFGWTFTPGGLWLLMVIGAFIGGFRASLVAAAWVSIYTYFVMPTDPSLWIQRVIWSFGIAGAVGILRRRERLRAALLEKITHNGGNEKVIRALDATRKLKLELSQNEWALAYIYAIESDLGNYLALSTGYTHLWEEIQQVEKWYALPGNVERWREWNKEK